jgi:hypothetical protein
LCEVHLPPRQILAPRVQSKIVDGKFVSSRFDDMWPHLPADEMNRARGVPVMEAAE